MKKIFSLIVAFFMMAVIFPVHSGKVEASEQDLQLSCKSALLYDAKSNTVIYEKNASQRLPIASMTKLASLMIVFEAIEQGKLNLDDYITVSKEAADTEGSSAFLDFNSKYKVGDLIMTVIVCSANDSTVALAEAVAGSEGAFVRLLNKKAEEMNLQDTNFINSTGLPAVDHYSSALDISKIYTSIYDNEIYKKYSKIWMTELVHPSGRKTDIVNTNRLIRSYQGCQSGKTGFTNDAGFCLSASAVRGDMNLVGVVIGAESSKIRFNEMADLFDYGFDNYQNKILVSSKTPLINVDVENAKVSNVDLYSKTDVVKFLKIGEQFDFSLDYKLNTMKAPIMAGQTVGTLYVIDSNNIVIDECAIITRENIEEIKVNEILKKIFVNF